LEFESRWVEVLFLHSIQTASIVHPASYKMGTGSKEARWRVEGREASGEVKMMWTYTYTARHVFTAQRFVSIRTSLAPQDTKYMLLSRPWSKDQVS
jgi:hypothetical protein